MAFFFRVMVHVDMDAFFASIEQRDHPEWQGQPVAVGGLPDQRGAVRAACYEARVFGIRSAMPSFTARWLRPQAVFVRPRMFAYREESQRIMGLLKAIRARLQQISVDEAYLEWRVEGSGTDHGAVLEQVIPKAREIKDMIYRRCGLTARIGIVSNKLLVKLANYWQKPGSLFLIRESKKRHFLRPLDPGRLHGVGRVTVRILQEHGFRTIGDIQDHPGDLRSLLGLIRTSA